MGRINVKLNEVTHKRVREKSVTDDISIQSLVETLIDGWLEGRITIRNKPIATQLREESVKIKSAWNGPKPEPLKGFGAEEEVKTKPSDSWFDELVKNK